MRRAPLLVAPAVALTLACDGGATPPDGTPPPAVRVTAVDTLRPGQVGRVHGTGLAALRSLRLDGVAATELVVRSDSVAEFRVPSLRACETDMRTVQVSAEGAAPVGAVVRVAPSLALRPGESRVLTPDDLQCLRLPAADEDYVLSAANLAIPTAEVESPRTLLAVRVLGTGDAAAAGAAAGAGGAAAAPGGGRTPNLDQFTLDLTARARAGKIDPVLGRDFEVRQVVDILTRRRQNNPILVGEAGVGKTAVVEGFARRIVEGDVPEPLRNVTLRTLDLALLQAGAGVKGEFENRLKGLIEEVKNSPTPIILFIDEAHTMIGAGGAAGQNDAANLLKPALARGELRTIAATTWAEYKKFFEKDPALSRRFQLVKVEEPGEDQCLVMLRGVVPALEAHHGVRITDDGLDAAVRLSHRYLPDRQLPDKAVSVLDTACARLALGQQATPASLEAARRELDDLAVQERVLGREATLGVDHRERLGAIAARRAALEATLAGLSDRWTQESALVARIRELRGQIEHAHAAEGAPGDDLPALRAELAGRQAELQALQGETPLMRVEVDASIVGEVISGWTGVPVGKMLRDQLGMILALERHLGERIIGQDHALEILSKRVRTTAAKIEDPNKPKGVFMLVGPSGVGKTETALALGDLLYGGEQNLVTINMSEFQEAHTVSTLKGSPPGYVGYGEGGVLTEAVRRRPYSVVLLDEVEKAHPDVLELFFQVFDKGVMEDGEGRQIDFRNSVILLTTNAGTDTIMKLTADPETAPIPEALVAALKPELDAVFKPAFLGRMVLIPYYPVRDENLKQIIRLKLGKIARRLQETHRVTLGYGDPFVDAVAARCTEVESGARNVDNILSNTMLPEISRLLLEAIAGGTLPGAVRVGVDDAGELTYALAPAVRDAGWSLADAPAAAEVR
ncbi:type VI secretion system ATPase TssH [Roseisolibacter sp. H3M3-2]|uniref:type VI secretion system ATPase TssH n=1 Tax=Roseisolibacter sp. H3M3-2 TaxID=3031323 RepID=UPI0023D9ACA4|nr:type VI secretion system ATPase TssH [Roseisolibacter sp. H3M3-2]MDF1504621.1 type VI secretion system ATPase TssH [Roseisolibacter sp. H3M3-2]